MGRTWTSTGEMIERISRGGREGGSEGRDGEGKQEK